MSYLEVIILDIIFILLPLCMYVIYESYNKTLNIRKNNLFLEFALISSFYLILKYKISLENPPLLIISIPLIIALIEKKKLGIYLLSIFLIIYYLVWYKVNIYIILIEIIIYIIIYIIYLKEKIKKYLFSNIFILIKLISIFFYNSASVDKMINNNNYILVATSFFIITNFVIYMMERANSILNFQKSYNELKDEENVRMSIFKITHEIKNPITVCKGYLDMFDVEDKKKSEKYVSILKDEIKRVLVLLEDFLSINKIKIEKDIMDINLLLSETVRNFNIILKENNIDKQFEIDDDELYIMGDYNRLSQVIINMIKNSIEAIENDGYIKIYTKENNDKIEIYIEDNGIGMDEEELKRIKEAFFTTKKNGTGLGVYLSNEIIKEHEGTIKYYSKKNEGTKAVITLPIEKIF